MTRVPLRRLFTAALALALLTVPAGTAAQDNAEALFQEGRRLFDSLDYDAEKMTAITFTDGKVTAIKQVPWKSED